jgi:hypothetical protein
LKRMKIRRRAACTKVSFEKGVCVTFTFCHELERT